MLIVVTRVCNSAVANGSSAYLRGVFQSTMRLTLVVPVSICLLLAACSSAPDPKKELVASFQGLLPLVVDNDEGLLHGIELGMTIEEVKKHALKSDSLSDLGADFLFYEATVDSQRTYTYECNFDVKGLHTLSLLIYQKDQPSAAQLFTDFKNYYTKKYGAPVDAGIGYIWEVPAGKRPAKILLEEKTDYLYGVVSVHIYDRSFEPRPSSSDTLVLR